MNIEESHNNDNPSHASRNFFEPSSNGYYSAAAKGSQPQSQRFSLVATKRASIENIDILNGEEVKEKAEELEISMDRLSHADHERKLSITSKVSIDRFEGGEAEEV